MCYRSSQNTLECEGAYGCRRDLGFQPGPQAAGFGRCGWHWAPLGHDQQQTQGAGGFSQNWGKLSLAGFLAKSSVPGCRFDYWECLALQCGHEGNPGNPRVEGS